MVWIWKHQSSLPCINSSGCCWWCNDVTVWWIASCPFGDPEYEFTTVSDHVHPLWPQWNHLLIAASSRTMLHVIKLKSSQTGFANWHWVRCRQMASTVTRSNLPIEHLWNVLECCWFQRAEKNSQTSSSWGEGNRNSNNYSLQSSYAQDRLVLTLLKFKEERLKCHYWDSWSCTQVHWKTDLAKQDMNITNPL